MGNSFFWLLELNIVFSCWPHLSKVFVRGSAQYPFTAKAVRVDAWVDGVASGYAVLEKFPAMTNMKMNTVILLSLAACTGMLACPGAWATAVCQEQSYHLKTACPHPLSLAGPADERVY